VTCAEDAEYFGEALAGKLMPVIGRPASDTGFLEGEIERGVSE
jgi:hypothetical protein